ncbi:MAG: hypothetical protein ACPGID_05170 [Rubricella sp.]
MDRDAFVSRIRLRRLLARIGTLAIRNRAARRAAIHDAMFRDDAEAVAFPYALTHGHLPDFEDPRLFLEKVRWQFLHHPDPMMQLVTDKIAVRAYHRAVRATIPPPALIASGEDPDDLLGIDLPDAFILEASNGCGMNHIHMGGPVDRRRLVSLVRDWFATEHWRRHGELFYRGIPNRWLVEEYLPADRERIEYTVLCIAGEPLWVSVLATMPDGRKTRRPYDLSWRSVPIELVGFPAGDRAFPRPAFLDQLREDATRLGRHFFAARIDFLYHDGVFAFSEVTLSNNASVAPYRPVRMNAEFGERIDLARAPERLADGRRIAAELGWTVPPAFGFWGKARSPSPTAP